MRHFIIEQSDSNITAHSGLSLVGPAINRHTRLRQRLDQTIALRHGIRHSDVVKSYLGLLSIGKTDFEAIDALRNDDFFQAALDIERVPSVERLRQRMDERATDYGSLVEEASIEFLQNIEAAFTTWVGLKSENFDVTKGQIRVCNTSPGVERGFCGQCGRSLTYVAEEGWPGQVGILAPTLDDPEIASPTLHLYV